MRPEKLLDTLNMAAFAVVAMYDNTVCQMLIVLHLEITDATF